MPEIVYVSNEEELKSSLRLDHKLTVIKSDYVPAIFDGYNIQYCFNEAIEHGSINFYSLKHVFHPYKSINVIFESEIYSQLLHKVLKNNHSVAFVLSIDNIKLLRFCQCFMGALSYRHHLVYRDIYNDTPDKRIETIDVEAEMDQVLHDFWFGNEDPVIDLEIKNWSPVPYIIGKTEITEGVSVPAWSSFWDVEINTLEKVLKDTFISAFGELFAYSKDGLDKIQQFFEVECNKITRGGKKLRLYAFDYNNKDYHCAQSIEGPLNMLDNKSFVESITAIATAASKLLKEYKVATSKTVCSNNNPPTNLKSTGYEIYFQYNVDFAVRLLCQTIFDSSIKKGTQNVLNTFYANAVGEQAIPTIRAIKERTCPPGEGYYCDGLGNLHSFTYKINNNSWVAVWPEGESKLKTELRIVEGTAKDLLCTWEHPENKCVNLITDINTSAQPIEIIFESCESDLVSCTVNGIKPSKSPNINRGALRFLAYNAGDKKGYFFVFKDSKSSKTEPKVLLIEANCDKKNTLLASTKNYQKKVTLESDCPEFIDITNLFTTFEKSFAKNITTAVHEMFKPFLPCEYFQNASNGDDPKTKNNIRNLANTLFMKNKQYPKLKYFDDLLSIVELKDHIKFEIYLSNNFKTELKKIRQYNDNKNIIDLIVASFDTPQPQP